MIPLDDREGHAVDQDMLSRKRQKLSGDRANQLAQLTQGLTMAFIGHGTSFFPPPFFTTTSLNANSWKTKN